MKLRKVLGWVLSGFFLLLGIVIYVGLVGYSFSAYICFGIAALLALGQLLRTARLARRILAAFVGLGLLAALITAIPIARAAFAAPEPGCEYIVVLGAGLHGSRPSMTLSDRLAAAEAYLRKNPNSICVVSGGQGPGEDMTEAACMGQILAQRGISPDRIWLEERATSTYENLRFSLELIRQKTGKQPERLGIVSSEYHIYRACQTGKRLGITPVGIPAETSYTSLFINYFLREIPAVWYYTVSGG